MAMHYHIEIRPKTFVLQKAGRTSRGTYTERKSWQISTSPQKKHPAAKE